MAITSKLSTPIREYDKRTSPSDVHTSDAVPTTTAKTNSTTAEVIKEMIAAGIPREQILTPGQGKKDVLFMADDFNDPCAEFGD
jgi:hypothetical protein